MDWKTHLASRYPKLETHPAVARERVEAASSKLGAAFPGELVSLLTTSDGLTGDYGLGLIWPLDEIVSRNEHFRTFPEFRSLYMPFDALLFFGDAGNGDQFGYSLCGGEITKTDIFCWNHEDDSRTWVAPCLPTYLDWWLSGKIKV